MYYPSETVMTGVVVLIFVMWFFVIVIGETASFIKRFRQPYWRQPMPIDNESEYAALSEWDGPSTELVPIRQSDD